MNSGRHFYEDDSVALTRDTTSSNTAAGLTATSYIFVGGDSFSIAIPNSLSGHAGMTIQGNLSNPLAQDGSTTGRWATDQLLKGMSKSTKALNPSFTANWVDVATILPTVVFRSIDNVPLRYMRLSGTAVAGLSTTAGGTTAFIAFLWGTQFTQGQ